MAEQPVMTIDRGYFDSRAEALEDMIEIGYWPTTYVSAPSPELPLHWHDGNSVGYLIEGETYVLDGDGTRQVLRAGDRLNLPAGAVHAEGKVEDQVIYIVGLELPRDFREAFAMLDPEAYPEPRRLALDPSMFG